MVSDVVKTMKENMRQMTDTLESYKTPLISRKAKPTTKDDFDREFKASIKERYSEIKEGGKSIHAMMKATNKVLRVSNASSNWRAYVDFINNFVVEGLCGVVSCSLDYLYEQIDPGCISRDDKLPIIEIKLDLVSVRHSDDGERVEEVRFIPDLLESDGKGIRDLVNNWISSFFNVSTLFKRLDNEGTYFREMQMDHGVNILMANINETLQENEDACMDVKAQYDRHSYLWLTDLTTFFEKFIQESTITTELGQEMLDLKKVDEQLVKYEGIRDQINNMHSPMDIGWLRINTLPVKSQLMTWTSKWIEIVHQLSEGLPGGEA